MVIAKELYHTFFSLLAAGSWLFLCFLRHICLIHLDLSGRSELSIFMLYHSSVVRTLLHSKIHQFFGPL